LSARERWAVAAAVLVAGAIWFAGQQSNPPGFAQDESSIAFNALCIAQHGVDEHGVAHPLFFRAFGEYKNPVFIYTLAGVFKIVKPSNLVARRVSAIAGFAAVLALTWLAWGTSCSAFVTIATLLTAAATPNLFEISRLAFEVAFYPCVLTLFLIAAHAAFRRERWRAPLVLALAATLIVLTYTYSIGRLHAPLLLAAFAILGYTRARRTPLLALIAIYVTAAIVPMIVFNANHGGALTERFRRLSAASQPIAIRALENLSPMYAIAGDPNERHHVQRSGGSILLMTWILGAIGFVAALRSRDRWWWFVAVGTLLSIVPATLTSDVHHSLRLIAYPIFLVVLAMRAFGDMCPSSGLRPPSPEGEGTEGRDLRNRLDEGECIEGRDLRNRLDEGECIEGRDLQGPLPAGEGGRRPGEGRGRLATSAMLILGLAQAIFFFAIFHRDGPKRVLAFDAGFGRLFKAAIAQKAPLVVSQSCFMQADWYGAQNGVDRLQFQVLWDTRSAPPGSVVISDAPPCDRCAVIAREGIWSAYRVL
jgi:hypothetical protein